MNGCCKISYVSLASDMPHISHETAAVVDRDQDNYSILPDNILSRATISLIIANVKLNDMGRVTISINAIKLHC